ncbi:MAG: response regulator [Deltaproteobacteria bacterium]|jgi:DNA-binding response OmpR family regulator|nr:response regulator [Deltaproteobacteria bacterium]
MGNKVLLVDDDEKLRKLVAEYLEGYGFQVTALPDSRSVLSTIRNESPDIVILDIMLPGKDGLEVLKEIRSEFSVAVIMLTAKGDDADRIVGLELGADDYLPKPFNPRELLARIKAVTRRIPSQGVGGADVTSQAIRRQLKAILSADVKDYSRLMSENEMWTIQTLKNYRSLIASHVRSHQGRVVDSPGDNLLAEFGSVVHAAECAVEIQRNLSTRNKTLPDDKRMEYRIGVNLGDVVIDRGKLYGDGVNIAARIEKLADPGGIAVSGTVYDEIENKLPLSCEFIGEHTVKNIQKPIRVYRIKI